jgi:tRNA-2-methylthio-N6-dimethylallyladenosine synthase
VLKAMRRSYRSEKFLGILDKVRAAIPDAAITTDLIVGFPGETEADFAQTLRVVEASRFFGLHLPVLHPPRDSRSDDAGQVPKAVVQERFDRLIALQEDVSWAGEPPFEGP